MWFFNLELDEYVSLICWICIGIFILILLLLICILSLMRQITNHCDSAEPFVVNGNYDLTDKIVIITGANSGIGKETTRCMAKTNATIIMACRNIKKSIPIQQDIITETGNNNIFLMKLDLSDLNNINEFVDEFKNKYNKLNILMCNAGIAPYEKNQKTSDGLELAFGVNHIGNMHLILLLRSIMTDTFDIDNEYSRIVITGAMAHQRRMLCCCPKMFEYDINKLNDHPTMAAYCHSKLCSLMFIKEFVYRFPLNSSKIYCVTLHPGVGKTELGLNKDNEIKADGCCKRCAGGLMQRLTDTVGQLAYTQIRCALIKISNLNNGSYYRGSENKDDEIDSIVLDQQKTTELWDVSMDIIQDIVGKQDYL